MPKKTLENFLTIRDALRRLRIPGAYFAGAREFVLQQIETSHQDLIRRPEGSPDEIYFDDTPENLDLFRKLTNNYLKSEEQEKEQLRPMKRRKQLPMSIEESKKTIQKEDELVLISIPRVINNLEMPKKYLPAAKDYIVQNLQKDHPEITIQFKTRWKSPFFPNNPENLNLVQTYLTKFEASQIKKVKDEYQEKPAKSIPKVKERLKETPPTKPLDTLNITGIILYSRRHILAQEKIPPEFVDKYKPTVSLNGESYFTKGQREEITLHFKKSLETLAQPDSKPLP